MQRCRISASGIKDIDPRISDVTHAFVAQTRNSPFMLHKILRSFQTSRATRKRSRSSLLPIPFWYQRFSRSEFHILQSAHKIDDLHLAIVLLDMARYGKLAINAVFPGRF